MWWIQPVAEPASDYQTTLSQLPANKKVFEWSTQTRPGALYATLLIKTPVPDMPPTTNVLPKDKPNVKASAQVP
jgi:hypothetical protein